MGELKLQTDHGTLTIETPAFMPVGTLGTVKGLWQEDLEELGYDLILANTYHLYLRPGRITQELGGLKKFMSWQKHAVLTDSGGFQVYSLADRVKFLEEGVSFASHIDGSRHLFTPAQTIDTQLGFGSDIMMVLDDCPPGDATRDRLLQSLDRTHRWARTAIQHYQNGIENGSIQPARQKIFGIIQGGIDEELRKQSTDYIQSQPFHGIALGGLSVGEKREDFYKVLEVLQSQLDTKRPHYLMGVGTIPDFLEAVRNGIDMFDCVLPTRNARNGQILTTEGKLNLRNAKHARQQDPPDPNCQCRVCRRYSLAYLRHLFISGEMLGPQMATFHNLHFYNQFMKSMRVAIRQNNFQSFYKKWKKITF